MTDQIIAFNDSDIIDSFLETSVFKLIIAQHRLDYIKENIEHMKKIINTYKLNIELEDNTLTISTTKHTRDPYAIIKLRDITNLIIKGTPYEKALSAFPDDYVVDCITLRESKSLENRRNRLEGPGGDTIKAIETFTKAELFMSKKCVCVIARSYKALKEVRWIVESVFDGNVHPAYLLKRLMVKRELEKDGEKVGINWEKYLPPVKSKLKNKRGDGKKKKAEKAKKKNENVNE